MVKSAGLFHCSAERTLNESEGTTASMLRALKGEVRTSRPESQQKGDAEMKPRLWQTVVTVGLVCSMAGSLSAQTFGFQSLPKDRPQLGCRYLHPFFDVPDLDMSALSGVYEVYTNVPVSRTINLVGSIPFMTMDYDYTWSEFGDAEKYRFDESGIGNFHIGMQYHPGAGDNRSSNVAFRVFLPTATDEANG